MRISAVVVFLYILTQSYLTFASDCQIDERLECQIERLHTSALLDNGYDHNTRTLLGILSVQNATLHLIRELQQRALDAGIRVSPFEDELKLYQRQWTTAVFESTGRIAEMTDTQAVPNPRSSFSDGTSLEFGNEESEI